jgi:hypothetical protein
MTGTRLVATLLAVAVLGCGERQATPRADTVAGGAWAVSLTAWGPVRFGTPAAEARRVLHVPADSTASTAESCERIAGGDSTGASLMVVNDTVVRVDVDSLPTATAWGDRVGDREADVLARHAGHVSVSPHKYTGPTGHYLTVTAPDDTLHALVFETDGERVTTYRAGRRPEVEWVEGCS